MANVEHLETALAGPPADGEKHADAIIAEAAEPEGQGNQMGASVKSEEKENGQSAPSTVDVEPDVKQEALPDVKAEQLTKNDRMPPTDDQLTSTLLEYLEEDTFTMDITERQLRNRLEKHFGVPLKDRKSIIRDKIMTFIQAKQQQETGPGADQEGEDAEEEEEEEEEQPKKRKRGGGGLNAGCGLSEPLQAFLGVETMSRPQVVKALWKYIKENDLQIPENRRKIRVDEKLGTIFNHPLDMLNMNKQLSKHVYTLEGSSRAAVDTQDDDDEPRPKKSKPAPKKRKASNKSDPDAPKKASAFTRPLLVSPLMSKWLGGDTQISRPELTKRFWAYAKENNLLNPNNKSEVICDAALKELTGEDSFKCFGFAKYIKDHLLGYADVNGEVKKEVKEEIKEEAE